MNVFYLFKHTFSDASSFLSCLVHSVSTSPHLFRAKRIQNRAVVNESPTERLVKELKAENGRLLQRLSRLAQEGRRANDETSKNRS